MQTVRRSLEVVHCVAIVALSLRTFFFLPVQVPTDSMAPTLRGHRIEDRSDWPPEKAAPAGFQALLRFLAHGERHWSLVSPESARLRLVDAAPSPVMLFLTRQRIELGSRRVTLWNIPPGLLDVLGLEDGDEFDAGEIILRAGSFSGDRFLINRFSINFSKPKTGEIVVFSNRALDALPKGVCYVKRIAKGILSTPGHSFLVGDNPDLSSDSRHWGEIPNDWILGRAGPVFWPLSPRCFRAPE